MAKKLTRDRNIAPAPALWRKALKQERIMIGKLIGAAIGKRVAGPGEETKGELIGFFAPAIAKRIVGPLGLALAGGWVAKKLWDRRKASRARTAEAGA
jgi:hypothetical protein